jgi:hypothetical protein
MPAKNNETLPDRSKPETTGIALTIDEKKEDVRRLDMYLRDFDRLRDGLEHINDPKLRKRLGKATLNLKEKFKVSADTLMQEIREEVFAEQGMKETDIRYYGGQFRGGYKGQKGGPKV